MTRPRPAGPPGLKHVPLAREERRRVRWCDAAGIPHTGTMEQRALMGRELVTVLVRPDRARKALVRVSPNDLRDLGPAVPRSPPVPVGARVVPFARRVPVFGAHETSGGAA